MTIMEKLYNKGFLSYPRTETTKFNPTINLRKVVSSLEHNTDFGDFAKGLLQVNSGLVQKMVSLMTKLIPRSILLKMLIVTNLQMTNGEFMNCLPGIFLQLFQKMPVEVKQQ